MPEISRFLGIIIRMFVSEHNPPHFHAFYNEHEAVFFNRSSGDVQGKLPPRIHGIVIEWADMHQKDLMENWNRLRGNKTIKKLILWFSYESKANRVS